MIDVSVVIPTYKEEKYIANTIRQLCLQTVYPNMQIVIADYDPDKTGLTKKAVTTSMGYHKNHVKIVDVPKNGIGFARDTGIMAADGKYIVNFDGDSTFHSKDDILNMVDALGKPNYSVVDKTLVPVRATHCSVQIENNELNNSEAMKFNMLYTFRNAFLTMYRLPVAYEQGLTFSKQTYIESGGFRDVREMEGPLLCTDMTIKWGIYCLRFVPEVIVKTSARRGVGSNGIFFDSNYDHAYR